MAEAALGLGTNLGDREAYLARAVEALAETGGIRLEQVSRLYRTAPWGVSDQPDFLNLCVLIETDLSPEALLAACKRIESELGRRDGLRWGPREIDIDLLIMPGVTMDTETLSLPHPRMGLRRFVLDPLAEIVPGWMIGETTVQEQSAALKRDAADQMCEPDEDATRRFALLRST